jgi:hypothetical protein
MILLTHIIIALASVAFASYLLIRPSRGKFYVNYAFIAATLASGTYLVLSTGVAMLSACASGLAYLAVVAGLSAVTWRKLAHQTTR